MKVIVDDSRCAGHGVCVASCPEVFAFADDGYAVAQESDVYGERADAVRDAIENCPEHAITIQSE
jgi:ferredoxin